MGTQVSSNISRLLKMRGQKRLEVRDLVTERILGFDYNTSPGLSLKFLETRNKESEGGSWTEYSVLYEIKKITETPHYMAHVFELLFRSVGLLLKDIQVDSMGLQEVECGLSEYYVLIYIISNGNEKEKYEFE